MNDVAGLNRSDPVRELLAQWEEQRQQGRAPTAEELCPDDTQLQSALRERILRQEKLNAVLDVSAQVDAAASATIAPAMPQVEGYEILEVIGHGGMGVVYKARQVGLNRLVALKMILAGARASQQELARFHLEAEAVAQLQHPNIVQVYDVGDQDGCPFLALELVGGGNLAQNLGSAPLLPRPAASMIRRIALAVQHAHEHGVVHRDLKPANILIALDGAPKITDFGLAKRLQADLGYTQTGTVIGSPSYMAPEQAEGLVHDIGPATDIYALGAILYELLTGRPPFKAATMLETLEQVRTHEPSAPRSLQPNIPKDLETICLKCLAKSAADRYATAQELADDLDRYLNDEPIAARSLTMLDRVVRNVAHSGLRADFRTMSNIQFSLAPFPLLIHLAVYLTLRDDPRRPFWMTATTALLVLAMTFVLLFHHGTMLQLVSSQQRRHYYTVWTAHNTAVLLSLFVVWQLLPLSEPRQIYIVYPLWAVLAGVSFLAHAADMGSLYLAGIACFIIAFLATLAPEWAPLIIGTFMSANLTAQAIYARRLSG